MDSITIYPKNEKQKSLLKSLLQEMNVRFEIEESNEQTLLSGSEIIAKISKSIKQTESRKRKELTNDQQKQFLS